MLKAVYGQAERKRTIIIITIHRTGRVNIIKKKRKPNKSYRPAWLACSRNCFFIGHFLYCSYTTAADGNPFYGVTQGNIYSDLYYDFMYTYCDNLILIASQIIVHNNNIKYGVASGGFGVLLIYYLRGRGKGSHKTFNYRCFLDSPLKDQLCTAYTQRILQSS